MIQRNDLPGFLYDTIKYKAMTAANVSRAVRRSIRNITATHKMAPIKLSHIL